VDENGVTIIYNKKVSEIDGLKPEEVLGKNIFEVYPSLTLETSTLMQTLKTGNSINKMQQTFINSRGKKITTVNTTVPIRFDDGEKGAMEISRDITQLEEMVDNLNQLRSQVSGENGKKISKRSKGSYKKNNNTNYTFKDIIGESFVFHHSLQEAMKAAGSDSSVLLYGETGTGKELFAQSIHNASSRRKNPFIAQNCAALPKDLLEGLLFGTRKGGFTGAKSRPGLFEQASGGTILLDEINSMDPALQAKLLRVLQENRVRRIGGQNEIDVDVRVIATMNMHPDLAFQKNLLREDLFYRLSVVYIEIPPLREHRKDIPLLVEHFIEQYNDKFSKSVKDVEEGLMDILKQYDWPGNVRELQHVIESGFNMLQNEECLRFEDLPRYLKDRLNGSEINVPGLRCSTLSNDDLPSLEEVLENIEIQLIKKGLEKNEGNISAAARSLNISRQSLQYKIKKYGIKTATYN
ncbi:MAG: sigma-54 interaction domain-containing protein, partial [Halanaerobiales bacterium]